jgi:hypothetical protein
VVERDNDGHWMHNPVICQVCGYTITGATNVNGDGVDDGPQTGTFSVCLKCGEVSVYQVSVFGVSLREATMDELAEFMRAHGDKIARLHRYRAVFGLGEDQP